jgi:hypothetical protein
MCVFLKLSLFFVVVDPDPKLILVGKIRIQEGKKDPQKWNNYKGTKLHV